MERLATILEETALLMESDGDSHWASWLKRDASDLRLGDVRGAEHFLSGFGGMGSLNDVYGRPGPSKPEEEKETIEKICDRLSSASELARRIIRDSKI